MELPANNTLLYSDGVYLSVSTNQDFWVYPITNQGIGTEIPIVGSDWSSILGQGIVKRRVFLVVRGYNRVYGWQTVEGATNGEPPIFYLVHKIGVILFTPP